MLRITVSHVSKACSCAKEERKLLYQQRHACQCPCLSARSLSAELLLLAAFLFASTGSVLASGDDAVKSEAEFCRGSEVLHTLAICKYLSQRAISKQVGLCKDNTARHAGLVVIVVTRLSA